MRDLRCPLGHEVTVVGGMRRCVECTRALSRTERPRRSDGRGLARVSEIRALELASVQAAIARRDVEDAQRARITVAELHARREKSQREDADRALVEERLERLGRDVSRIHADDVERVVSTDSRLLEGSKPWRVLERFARSGKAFCVISGPSGTGKTVAAMALKARVGGLVIRPEELVTAFRNEHDAARSLRDQILDTALVVLDDLGFELAGEHGAKMSERDRAALVRAFQVFIDQRQGGRRQSVVTTNLARDALREEFDVRTINRITHGGALVELVGENLRRVS